MSRPPLLTALALYLSFICPSFCKSHKPPPVPASFQDLYLTLDTYLTSFNTILTVGGGIPTYPYLPSGSLSNADANAGSQLINADYLVGVQLQLQALKANGVRAVMLEI